MKIAGQLLALAISLGAVVFLAGLVENLFDSVGGEYVFGAAILVAVLLCRRFGWM